MEFARMLLVLIIVLVVLALMFIIIHDMIFNIKSVRTAVLLFVRAIGKQSIIGSLIAGPLGGLVSTFVWF
ncbi:hypothetical protein A3K64_01150 [Candidatus Micrarchaeota archaeon RBG_16_36_9]|nr:MAG: hypothetical protein A3K64_01150 [Candidatus Micrarchaeota archaeon RBG_16_36_9]